MAENDVTPIRKQYLDVKRQYPGTIVFFRLGDFYETFDGDAELVARELEIVLTGRNVAKGQRIPMAGIPYHAAEGYIARLIGKGYHVAICEQVGSQAVKGLFRREVVRVVTPGTIVEPGMLDSRRNNYLAALAVAPEGGRAGLAYVDITTGEFAGAQIQAADVWGAVRQELLRLRPAELLVPDGPQKDPALEGVTCPHTRLPAWKFESGRARSTLLEHFAVSSLAGFGLEHLPLAVAACAAILQYLKDTQPAALGLLVSVRTYSLDEFMALDAATRRNLELTETLRAGQVKGSLLGVLERTVTPMGTRLLRQWVSQPLLNQIKIQARLALVALFHSQGLLRAELLAALKPLADLERITNRVVGGTAIPRDLTALRATLAELPRIQSLLRQEQPGTPDAEGVSGADGPRDSDSADLRRASSISSPSPLIDLAAPVDGCGDVLDLLQAAMADDPPAVLGKLGVIRPGYSAELDGIAGASRHAREWIAGLESAERQRTGIKGLKVSYNKVFGYYIELSRGQSANAPPDYIRKQTLVNAERYITPELKEYETLVLNAEERLLEVESRLFKDVCGQIAAGAARLLGTARALAQLDVVAALAEVAVRHNYCRPQIDPDGAYAVRGGRHPVVEQYLPQGERFVPNDITFEPGELVQVITGPNMSGKSTYLRQAALISLLAQIGSFVPADEARLGIVDRIFTRIGAQDEIHAGQSTFMVEMIETANILHHATPRSLLILDEIGRGTSTYDGLSLAWAIVEYVHNHPRLRSKTLFATHYHELTDLASLLPGVRNYNVAVAEEGDHVVFLHRIVPGGTDRSYGIHVAQLAGLPRPVITRAQEILAQLEASAGRAVRLDGSAARQMALFPETSPLLDELRQLDLNSMMPVEALTRLYEWKAKYGK